MIPKNKCKRCSKKFTSNHRSQKFCSTSCSKKASALIAQSCKGCCKKFTPSHVHQKFCSVVCYRKANSSETQLPLPTRLIHSRAKIKQLENQLSRKDQEIGRLQETHTEVAEAVRAAQPIKLVPYKTSLRTTKVIAVPVLKFSDWHIGEYVNPRETEGYGWFNWVIAQRRVDYIVEKFLHWVETHRADFTIDECVVFCEGDFIFGGIHAELKATDEFPPPVQTANAGYLLGDALVKIAPNFKKLRVIEVGADNHSRLQPKPQFKEKATNSLSFLVYAIANARLERQKNIEIEFAQGIKYLATVNIKKFLIEHGDIIKAWMGVPYYGMARLAGREARKRMNTNKGFDYQSIAHWHVPGVVERTILVNGSLLGTTEFDHGQGRYAPPSQVSFMVHARHGIFDWTPWTPPQALTRKG